MDATGRTGRGNDPAADLVVGTELVLAAGSMSPADIAARIREGRIEVPVFAGGRFLLEAGGTAFAEGRVVRRGGRHFLKLTRLFGPEATA